MNNWSKFKSMAQWSLRGGGLEPMDDSGFEEMSLPDQLGFCAEWAGSIAGQLGEFADWLEAQAAR